MTAGELLKKVMPRLKGPTELPFLEALQIAIDAVTDRLWINKSDMLRADLSDDYLAGATSVNLGSSFLGFYTQPWIEGRSETLLPLLPGTKHTFTQAGIPLYFEVRDKTLTLYPTPSSDGTLLGEVYAKPTVIGCMADDIPWSGTYDRALIEITLFALGVGSTVVVDQAFEAFVRDQIDAHVHRKIRKGITWLYPA